MLDFEVLHFLSTFLCCAVQIARLHFTVPMRINWNSTITVLVWVFFARSFLYCYEASNINLADSRAGTHFSQMLLSNEPWPVPS